jgi:hypothetical protein
MSNVDSSVSVEPAECAWFGVDGKLVLMNRFHVFFLSGQMKINEHFVDTLSALV